MEARNILQELPFELQYEILRFLDTTTRCYFLEIESLSEVTFLSLKKQIAIRSSNQIAVLQNDSLTLGSDECQLLVTYMKIKIDKRQIKRLKVERIKHCDEMEFLLENSVEVEIGFTELTELFNFKMGKYLSKVTSVQRMNSGFDLNLNETTKLFKPISNIKFLGLIFNTNATTSKGFYKTFKELLKSKSILGINMEINFSIPNRAPKYLKILNEMQVKKKISLEMKESASTVATYEDKKKDNKVYRTYDSFAETLGFGNIHDLSIGVCSFCSSDLTWIKQLKNLRELTLQGSSKYISGFKYLMGNENPNIEVLNLLGLELGYSQAEMTSDSREQLIPLSFKKFTNLKTLSISSCTFQGISGTIFSAEGLPNNVGIINLSICLIDWKEIETFPDNVFKVTILGFKEIEIDSILSNGFNCVSLLSTNIKMYTLNRVLTMC